MLGAQRQHATLQHAGGIQRAAPQVRATLCALVGLLWCPCDALGAPASVQLVRAGLCPVAVWLPAAACSCQWSPAPLLAVCLRPRKSPCPISMEGSAPSPTHQPNAARIMAGLVLHGNHTC